MKTWSEALFVSCVIVMFVFVFAVGFMYQLQQYRMHVAVENYLNNQGGAR